MNRCRAVLFVLAAGALLAGMHRPAEARSIQEAGYARMVSGMQENAEFANSHVLFYSGPRNLKQVALTFDDGPEMQYTPQILDVLKRNDVHATFFLVGARAEKYPQIVKRISDEGHAIGNHTYDHANLTKLTVEQVRDEVEQGERSLTKILGYHPAIFRAPFGAANAPVLREVAHMNYKIIDWSVDTRDWAGVSTNQIVANVRKEVFPGGIILQHTFAGRGGLRNTVEALPQIIDELKANGYAFVTIPELLKIPSHME
ncbi:MAG: polysaccharide deacetylase family protein [Tumebacillaceae bacterium]